MEAIIDRKYFEESAFSDLYSYIGQRSMSVRFRVNGLLPKHLFNRVDERIQGAWEPNRYI